jgi:hypothetical protein
MVHKQFIRCETQAVGKHKILCKAVTLIFLFTLPVFYAGAQNNRVTVSTTIDTSQFPQWTKDLRRWEIIAFGSFPFTMFFATFFMDTYRFATAGGWNDYRYAPWPFKSAGAVDMTKNEYETTMIMAASLSAIVAVADLIIVQIKRQKARKRAESLPVGTTIIIKRPWPAIPPPEESVADDSSPAVLQN